MPQASIVDEEKAKEAVSILLWAPQLTVREAMILANFTIDEANTKSMQQKVAQSMPMKAKKASLTTAHASVSISTGVLMIQEFLTRTVCPPTMKLDATRTSLLNRRGK
jgi:hypothetical protein